MSPRRVLVEHSSAELTEWRAFERAFGSLAPLDDQRFGVVASAVWNASGGIPDGEGVQARRRPATPADFFAIPGPQTDAADDASTDEPDLDTDDGDGDGDVAGDEVDPLAAFKGQLVMWALQHNARVKKARELEERLSSLQPPDDPDSN